MKKSASYIIAILKDHLGEGPEELGKLLIKSFINKLPEAKIKPATIIFMNAGIHLALNDSPVLESLKILENNGVEILACGTCLDYFQKKDALSVGRVSNMHEIIERLSQASKVIFP